MRKTLLARLLISAAFVGIAQAQVISYNAGLAGSPPVVPPATDGDWDIVEAVGGAGVVGLSPDPGTGLNALAIGSLGGSTTFLKTINLDPTPTYEFMVTMRVAAAGQSGAMRMAVEQNDGFFEDTWFLNFEIVAGELRLNTTVSPTGGACGSVATFYTCPGALDGNYHTFALRKPVAGIPALFDVVYDGVVIGTASSSCGGGVGGASPNHAFFRIDGGQDGRARVHRVELRATGPVGNSTCTPAVPNSTGVGAQISAFGHENPFGNHLRLLASQMPTNQFGYFLGSREAGSLSNPGGSMGVLCLGGTIGRFAAQVQDTGTGGQFEIAVDTQNMPTGPSDAVFPGESWNFQAWFRDTTAGGMPTSNFTDSVRIAFD